MRSGCCATATKYFPALIKAIDGAQAEVWLETYIFADDAAGRAVADALVPAAQRGVTVRVLVDGWGAKHYLTPRWRTLVAGGVDLIKYRPEVAPWQFRSHRLRRLHRKLCHVDGRIAFVGGINVIDDMNTPGHKPPRVDFAVSVEGPLLVPIMSYDAARMGDRRARAVAELDVPLFPEESQRRRAGTQTAKFVIRDNLRYRSDIERAYLTAIRTAHVGDRDRHVRTSFRRPHFRHALMAAARRGVKVTLLLQARVEYELLH